MRTYNEKNVMNGGKEKTMLHFGILGCGSVADYHADAIASLTDAKLVVACGGRNAEAFCKKHGIRMAGTYEEMLNDTGVDVIAICTPSGSHAQDALKAIAADKHVIIEKPICITAEDADTLERAAENSGKIVSAIFQYRFSDAIQEIKKAMDSGAFGKVISCALTMRYFRGKDYYDSGVWRGTKAMDGGGVLMNQGIHGIDLIAYLIGGVREVRGYASTLLRDIEVEDTASAALLFKSGALGTIDATVCNKGGGPLKIEICGENGSVMIEDENIMQWSLDRPCGIPVGKVSDSSPGTSPTGISTENHKRQYRNIAAAIRGEEALAVGIAEGRHALRIVLGVYESSASGRPAII